MACDMIESCINRTEGAFQQWLKKSVTFISTDYIIPSEMCAMVNVILDAKNQSFKLCAVDGIDVVSIAQPLFNIITTSLIAKLQDDWNKYDLEDITQVLNQVFFRNVKINMNCQWIFYWNMMAISKSFIDGQFLFYVYMFLVSMVACTMPSILPSSALSLFNREVNQSQSHP